MGTWSSWASTTYVPSFLAGMGGGGGIGRGRRGPTGRSRSPVGKEGFAVYMGSGLQAWRVGCAEVHAREVATEAVAARRLLHAGLQQISSFLRG